ncbi:SH3 domain-containing protein [Aggregatilinea lenta]|uniref:SH3 domain-containing protein n=1 Tax=Aggregatilinea lenta TaxID=913108 RepID=UPI000E5AF12E|nr:SH3 domain-containing protein [Aggregatilinea lenta]
MTRKVLPLLLGLALIVAITPFAPVGDTPTAHAGGSWSAWAYNADTGQLVHVFPDGAPAVEMMFPLPPGTSSYPTDLTISRDGALLAACLTDDIGAASVRVYDIYAGVYVAAYIPTGPILGCSLDQYSFSEDGTQLAFGIINHFGFDPAETRPSWEVVVMEMNTSAILYRLDANTAAVAALGEELVNVLPMIRTFQMKTATFPGLITFAPIYYASEGAPEYPSMVWNLTDSTVQIAGPYGKSGFDVLLPNSEVIWVDADASFPVTTPMGPGPAFNVMMYSNKMGDRYPILVEPDMIPLNARFVDDGRKAAVMMMNADGSATSWAVVDRSGAVYALPALDTYEVWGTMDGYVFVSNSSSGGPVEIRYHRFAEGNPTPTEFVAWTDMAGGFWRIIWANPLSGGAGLPAFPPAGILGEPPVMPTATTGVPPLDPTVTLPAGPTATLPAGPTGTATLTALSVGGRATVTTTEGDQLRVRSGAGTAYAVLFYLPAGSGVNLMEGPVEADALTWWRVRADDGRMGWAVEGVMDGGSFLQTLTPVG